MTDQANDEPATTTSEPELISFAEFLESVPPSQQRKIKNLWVRRAPSGSSPHFELQAPQLQLHCTSDVCNGLRFFRYRDGDLRRYSDDKVKMTYVTYVCSNCRKQTKMFSLYATFDDKNPFIGEAYKFGEFPAYGPPTPARLIRLLGDDRELFLNGRRCEIQGLGIGAFVYYRRVVENQKSSILDEIIRVASKIGAPAEMVSALETAKSETQFSKAMQSVKDAIPPALLINGHNPLTLLHSALSEGLHENSDEVCLEIAHDVRVVLIELSDRLGQALKDEAELNTAVTRLLKAKQEKQKKQAGEST